MSSCCSQDGGSFSPKLPAERIYLTFRFAPILNGKTINSIVSVTPEVVAGVDPTPTAIISTVTPPGIVESGLSVSVLAIDGLSATSYEITVVVDTVAPVERLALRATLPVT